MESRSLKADLGAMGSAAVDMAVVKAEGWVEVEAVGWEMVAMVVTAGSAAKAEGMEAEGWAEVVLVDLVEAVKAATAGLEAELVATSL